MGRFHTNCSGMMAERAARLTALGFVWDKPSPKVAAAVVAAARKAPAAQKLAAKRQRQTEVSGTCAHVTK
jgi:hypothetical protein